MAWFAVMGAESVSYHQATVLGRGDDHPGRALDYYGSRGETPLRWGGAGAARLGLQGEVTPDAYRLAFGPGGFRDPLTGERLVSTKRPGVELVVSAHKSLSLLGLVGRADDMHAILDAETAGTMAFLDDRMQARGGRRGRAATPTPTGGLVYAVTRHATSRDGDPALHDHVLIANVCEMLDTPGGHKALYSAMVRDLVEAAAMTGRLQSAATAVRLGYSVETDHGRSGRARDWRIAGIPTEVCEIFSKRSDEIVEYLAEQGYQGHRARNVAARKTRAPKRGTGVDELMPRWIAELEDHGWTVERLEASLAEARERGTGLAPPLTDAEIRTLIVELTDPEGEFLRRGKVFGRSRLVAEIAPRLYGHDPRELCPVVDCVLASPQVVPLIGVAGAREQPYTAAAVLGAEQTVADTIRRLATNRGAAVDAADVRRATAAKEAELGSYLSDGQRQAIRNVCCSGRAVDVVVGVAGSGKTTALDVTSRAFEAAGYRVLGTATSGQAARTLGREASVSAATMRSLLWRLDHGQLTLDDRTIVVLDEAAMTSDADLARLVLGAERAGSKVVLVGDHRQLGPVGPGGALQAVLEEHPSIVTVLDQNLRQRDPAERHALDQLRSGSAEAAVRFYADHGRISLAPTRTEALAAMVDAWAADTTAGHDTLMLAWRRASVAGLNRLGRARADQLGQLTGDDLVAPGGRLYAVGDPVVTLAPSHDGQLVTSQRGRVVAIDHRTTSLAMLTDDNRRVNLAGDQLDVEHLDHGYALTVHREQGATADRTHYLAEGGGRELAYVAMSRARGPSIVHAVADDLDQAVEDITHDWSTDRNQQWITRTAGPGIDPATRPPAADRTARRTRLATALDRLERLAPPDVTAELAAARAALDRLHRDRADLTGGTGRWQHHPAGRVAGELADARRQREQAERQAELHYAGSRERHRWRRLARLAARTERHAEDTWNDHTRPALERLDRKITRVEHRVTELETDGRFRRRWLAQHPDLARRMAQARRELRRAADQTGVTLEQSRDATSRPGPDLARQDHVSADVVEMQRRLDHLQRRRRIEPPGLSL